MDKEQYPSSMEAPQNLAMVKNPFFWKVKIKDL